MEIYIVRSGDTVSSVARSFGISVSRLVSDNGLERPDTLTVGQALIILTPETVYTIRSGDTLFSIARAFGTSVGALLRNNPQLSVTPSLRPGSVITIDFTDKPTQTRRINGYAYPFISQLLLRRVLPFLSTLTVFGYGFTETGELIEPNDTPLLATASVFGVATVLLLSSITENGNFSSERASLLFNDTGLQDTVLYSLVEIMRQKGYRGLDIDFEYVRLEDAEAFQSFVRNAVSIMSENGFFVNVDLAPKASAEQRGLLYEAHDYAALGAEADTVLLMTYEWGYTYGPPMAVAPIGPVTGVVDYALTQIPSDKILLGIPNYGYDWTLPFQKGITRAISLSNQYAVSLAGQYNVPIIFDEESQAPYFTYRTMGAEHIVWFEDVRSIRTKLQLMTDRNLLGIGYWNLMRPFAQNFSLLGVTVTPAGV